MRLSDDGAESDKSRRDSDEEENNTMITAFQGRVQSLYGARVLTADSAGR
jgi:hypothetical protein